MAGYVLDLREIDRSQVTAAGGKGANLGELSRIEGIAVPPGFCVTTHAFQRIMKDAPSIDSRVDRLSRLHPEERDEIRALSASIRGTIEAASIPRELAAAIADSLGRLGALHPWAVRSSATAEDAPTASFAGQHDSFLNVPGLEAVLDRVRRCWASLFSERAVIYRLRNELDQRSALMAVLVQRMVVPRAAGILFTADPTTGNRKVAAIEAAPGLGDALVSGRTNADAWRVSNGQVVNARIARAQPVLGEPEVARLDGLGRRIEAHFGTPQDIEWCLPDDGDFQFVQCRPITTLFPVPIASDGENHVYVSVGHQQMMTDAIKPLGLSVRRLTAAVPFHEAGGREFVDVTRILASPASRGDFLSLVRRSDPLIADAIQALLDREFVAPAREGAPAPRVVGSVPATIETDGAMVAALIARADASVAALKRDIRGHSGAALLDFIRADFEELKRILFDPQSHQAIMAGMEAAWWLNDHLETWLGEKNAADTLTQSVDNNVTSEMGLALLDVADVIRGHATVVAFLAHRDLDDGFLDALPAIPRGGREAHDAIVAFLDRYGMRCPGEIDITRPRWSERPRMLVPVIMGNVRHFEPGAGARRFEEGRRAAAAKKVEVLARLRALPDGEAKADETKRMIDRVRTFAGYREYPKYSMVSRYFVYKQAIMAEAGRLARSGIIRDPEDIFHLTFDELHDAVRTGRVDGALIRRRREAFATYRTLVPPRVLTSDGEMLWGAYHRDDVPAGALAGFSVSGGTVEGRARVVLNMEQAHLEPGDILVTTYTDPSWTPVFVGIAGLVTEVGGLMTHGAVIAREYGLPAVVGVEQATRRIRDGQRIRVHGTAGWVEMLDSPR